MDSVAVATSLLLLRGSYREQLPHAVLSVSRVLMFQGDRWVSTDGRWWSDGQSWRRRLSKQQRLATHRARVPIGSQVCRVVLRHGIAIKRGLWFVISMATGSSFWLHRPVIRVSNP